MTRDAKIVAALASAAALVFVSTTAGAQVAGAGADIQATTSLETGAEAADDRVESDPVSATADAAAETAEDVQADAGPTVAATDADIKAGATVVDTKGGIVGKIESVDANGAVISTGGARVQVPASSFAKNDAGLVIAMSKTELEAAAAAASPS